MHVHALLLHIAIFYHWQLFTMYTSQFSSTPKLDPLTLPLTYVTDHHLEVLLLKNLWTPKTMREMTFAEIVMTLTFNQPKSDKKRATKPPKYLDDYVKY